jgi:class 3 adenylate cyclase
LRLGTSGGIVPQAGIDPGLFSMKRKIAAIFAADIAGYSRLVAEDEEETLRRLASYRQVTDDFIARSGGRIFNTAGDAVLAEFPSAVEAVRCAIDIQESLRTRNMAYPPSRQMAFRIGITIGDVVERDGDLLGDGVNIAARLEGLAEAGGICISRAVHEQVANKLSVQFADIGAQEVKNIPTPVHAYMVAMRREDGTYATPQVRKPAKSQAAAQPNWMWPVAVTVVSLAAIGVGGFLYLTQIKTSAQSNMAPPNAARRAATVAPVSAAVAVAVPPSPIAAPPDRLAAAGIPFISDKARAALAADYAPAPDFKAFALNIAGINAFVTSQPSEEAAKSAAMEQCQKRADAAQSPRKCELYAVGEAIVYTAGRPPLPPTPWIRRDPASEQTFAAKNVPLVREAGKARLENVYVPARNNKAVALGPGGALFFVIALDSVEEAVRRALEACGGIAGAPCMIVALNDHFVVPIPASLKVTGVFKAAGNPAIVADMRDDVARRLADASSGWNAIATGTAGRPGLGLKATTEQAAVTAALAECARRDSHCQPIAIGPFAVGPN